MSNIFLLFENKQIRLENNTKILIGRDNSCDVVLSDNHVSRQHASLELKNNEITLIDLSSTNGTWVEGKRITKAVVKQNSAFRIADNNLSVRIQMNDSKENEVLQSDTMFFEKKVSGVLSKLENSELKEEVAVLRSLYNQKKEKLAEMAFYDALMNIYNRRYFDLKINEEIARAIRYKRNLALLLIDIDHFKKVNDIYGHQKGDEILTLVAELLKKTLRGTDMIFRYGGEEIIIILTETDEKKGLKVGENCREAVENGTKTAIQNGITISIGITSLKSVRTPAQIVKEADLALYKAKETGRNRVVIFREE